MKNKNSDAAWLENRIKLKTSGWVSLLLTNDTDNDDNDVTVEVWRNAVGECQMTGFSYNADADCNVAIQNVKSMLQELGVIAE